MDGMRPQFSPCCNGSVFAVSSFVVAVVVSAMQTKLRLDKVLCTVCTVCRLSRCSLCPCIV